MDREKSPEFNDHDFEPILAWAEAEVIQNGLPEEVKEDSLLAYLANCYSLVWKHGVIGFDIEDEQESRKAAALFIYLWTRGIKVDLAERCAEAYVKTYLVRQISPDDPVIV